MTDSKYEFKTARGWDCETCTTHVDLPFGVSTSLCPTCKRPRRLQWSCPVCTYYNDSKVTGIIKYCYLCKYENPLIESVKVARNPDDTWDCPVCTMSNEPHLTACAACQNDNVLLDPLRNPDLTMPILASKPSIAPTLTQTVDYDSNEIKPGSFCSLEGETSLMPEDFKVVSSKRFLFVFVSYVSAIFFDTNQKSWTTLEKKDCGTPYDESATGQIEAYQQMIVHQVTRLVNESIPVEGIIMGATTHSLLDTILVMLRMEKITTVGSTMVIQENPMDAIRKLIDSHKNLLFGC